MRVVGLEGIVVVVEGVGLGVVRGRGGALSEGELLEGEGVGSVLGGEMVAGIS